MIEEKKMYRVIVSMIRSLTRVAEKEIKLRKAVEKVLRTANMVI
ncbi:hypothetical protein HNR77_004241 [Paenibacillus sp. JGP012]|nr:hypothetical protein [Paenibacillus sp. JGP012]MBB6023141.1 hypothetical protein [Paenibacillus sp. JGP012]